MKKLITICLVLFCVFLATTFAEDENSCSTYRSEKTFGTPIECNKVSGKCSGSMITEYRYTKNGNECCSPDIPKLYCIGKTTKGIFYRKKEGANYIDKSDPNNWKVLDCVKYGCRKIQTIREGNYMDYACRPFPGS